MRQQTLADGSFEKFRKKARKELFLDDMEHDGWLLLLVWFHQGWHFRKL